MRLPVHSSETQKGISVVAVALNHVLLEVIGLECIELKGQNVVEADSVGEVEVLVNGRRQQLSHIVRVLFNVELEVVFEAIVIDIGLRSELSRQDIELPVIQVINS